MVRVRDGDLVGVSIAQNSSFEQKLFGKGQLHQGVIDLRERHSPSVLGNTH